MISATDGGRLWTTSQVIWPLRQRSSNPRWSHRSSSGVRNRYRAVQQCRGNSCRWLPCTATRLPIPVHLCSLQTCEVWGLLSDEWLWRPWILRIWCLCTRSHVFLWVCIAVSEEPSTSVFIDELVDGTEFLRIVGIYVRNCGMSRTRIVLLHWNCESSQHLNATEYISGSMKSLSVTGWLALWERYPYFCTTLEYRRFNMYVWIRTKRSV